MGKVALTAAIMDMCHQGHINLLDAMNEKADKVIVVLHSDESCWSIKRKIPIQPLDQRIRNLEITKLVDEVLVTHDDDPSQAFIAAVNMYPDHEFVFMRGDDNYDFPGRQTIEELNMPIEFVNYTPDISSTKIKDGLI